MLVVIKLGAVLTFHSPKYGKSIGLLNKKATMLCKNRYVLSRTLIS